MRTIGCSIGLVMLLALACAQPFAFQGFLKDNGNPANGIYDFRFRLYDASSGGTQVGTDQFANDLPVQNGLFTTTIDFGASAWTGADRYLEIAVRPGSSTGAYTALSPRVKINPTPYAIRAATAGTANPIGSAGGDLSGSYPNPTVARLQGRAVSSAAPSNGQVLKWNGTAWAPANDDTGTSLWQASGSNIFYNAGNVGIGTSNPLYRLHVETNASDRAIYGFHSAASGVSLGGWFESASPEGTGVLGLATATSGSTFGVYGQSASTDGRGVFGWATNGTGFTYGVYGQSDSLAGVGVYGWATYGIGFTYGGWFQSASTSGTGVLGWATASSGFTYGVAGQSDSPDGRGVLGWATATSGDTYGVFGRSESPSGRGVLGWATATSGWTIGVWAQSDSPNGRGVFGWATASSGFTYGVYGESASTAGTGVYGLATATSGDTYGVFGRSESPSGRGVYGLATATSGWTIGVVGQSYSPDGTGVYGHAAATSGTNYGVVGRSASTAGTGVYGDAVATSGINYGVVGRSASFNGTGVYGWVYATSGTTNGVYGQSDSSGGRGVVGWATSPNGYTSGVYGRSDSPDGRGVVGWANLSNGYTYGVYGHSNSPSGYGLYSSGRFAASGTKAFQIDHPLSPETHFLNHFCTEAPEPLNAYSGNVVTDAQGYAVVQLPDYFEAVNRDFRYQLTVIGQFAQAIVAEEIRNNRFVIRTDKPHVKVSWRVEAIRNDRWVQQYGYQTEQEKPEHYQGKYLHPELYGQPQERGIHYHPDPQPAPKETVKP